MDIYIIRDNKKGGMIARFYELYYGLDRLESTAYILNYKNSGSLPDGNASTKKVVKCNCASPWKQVMLIANISSSHKQARLIIFGRKSYAIALVSRLLIYLRMRSHPKIIYLIRNSENEQGLRNKLITYLLVSCLSRRSDRIIAISKGLLSEWQVRLNRSGDKRYIHNGIKPRYAFPIIKTECSKNRIRLLWVGRMHYQKNYGLFVRVIRSLKTQGIQVEATVYTDNIPHPELYDPNVNLVKWSSTIPFDEFDLFISTSIFEGFGRSLIESLSCSTPVVTTDCPYGPSEIINESCGFLVPNRDSIALAKAIICWSCLSSDKKREMRENAFKRSLCFSYDAMMHNYSIALQGAA